MSTSRSAAGAAMLGEHIYVVGKQEDVWLHVTQVTSVPYIVG